MHRSQKLWRPGGSRPGSALTVTVTGAQFSPLFDQLIVELMEDVRHASVNSCGATSDCEFFENFTRNIPVILSIDETIGWCGSNGKLFVASQI